MWNRDKPVEPIHPDEVKIAHPGADTVAGPIILLLIGLIVGGLGIAVGTANTWQGVTFLAVWVSLLLPFALMRWNSHIRRLFLAARAIEMKGLFGIKSIAWDEVRVLIIREGMDGDEVTIVGKRGLKFAVREDISRILNRVDETCADAFVLDYRTGRFFAPAESHNGDVQMRQTLTDLVKQGVARATWAMVAWAAIGVCVTGFMLGVLALAISNISAVPVTACWHFVFLCASAIGAVYMATRRHNERKRACEALAKLEAVSVVPRRLRGGRTVGLWVK